MAMRLVLLLALITTSLSFSAACLPRARFSGRRHCVLSMSSPPATLRVQYCGGWYRITVLAAFFVPANCL